MSSPPVSPTADLDAMFDVAIVGAGVVGCAIARSFATRGWRTLLLDKASDILEGASKGNSALLHTGFDEPAGSMELQLIRSGYATYRRIHERMNLPLVETGGLVVAWDDAQLGKLPAMSAHAAANGVETAIIDRAALFDREPELASHALGALVVPGESIIDPWSAPLAYVQQAILHGAQLVTDATVTALTHSDDRWEIQSSIGRFAARLVVNAAGLFGDRVEAMAGQPASFTIHPRKGQFLVYDKPASRLVRSIILRVPNERTKGVLLAPTVFGNLLLGPTADDQEDRVHAACDEATLRRIMAEGEAMLPALAGQTVTAAFAGLRPATEHRDYVLRVDAERRWITVGGIRSTGLSASLGLGEWAAERGGEVLGNPLPLPADDDLDWPTMPNLAEAEPRPYQQPARTDIVCHCEWVTRAEVQNALSGPTPARTLGGLKRRTRAMMGRCQGFGCAGAVAQLAPQLFQPERADDAE